ncbi:MAG: hypothetical protein PCALPYG88_0416 [uncultured Paraburkholderia sp.]|nr:MAG: hypothetical protein PCALPYG08_0417 [uncultured Paraburkholderia sp.]CAH2909032.1 MAG: hypothetical protein PCALPYG88_0416 [uncultured Paraburkholderia sp.]
MSAFDRTPCVQFQQAQGFLVVFLVVIAARLYLDGIPHFDTVTPPPNFLQRAPQLRRGNCVVTAWLPRATAAHFSTHGQRLAC